VIFTQISGGGGSTPGAGGGTDTSFEQCQTGADANKSQKCRLVAVTNSVQSFWNDQFPKETGKPYVPIKTVSFTGQVATNGCGTASSDVGPFYCPNDQRVYLDLTFFREMLQGQLGAKGGPFAEAYVVAHEYGHHIQNLTGVLEQARSSDTGPQSAQVRVELQADCYAGVWTANAVDTGYLEPITQDQINSALAAAEAVGDDRIQSKTQGQVNQETWTHGSSEQRQFWFTQGYRQGTPTACDTFSGSV
jgi:predicted metalloprotease